MERNTQTMIGQLRKGDRFVYKRTRTDVWEVMTPLDSKGKVAVNQLTESGHRVRKYDELVKGKKPVVFLRHTVPVSGEDIFLSDLKRGDVFLSPPDENGDQHEYLVVETGNGPTGTFCKVWKKDAPTHTYAPMLSTVTYLRTI
jgi:hypothetical protein